MRAVDYDPARVARKEKALAIASLAEEILHTCVEHGNDKAWLRQWLNEHIRRWVDKRDVRDT
jgi:hypothetical protein